MKTIKKVTDWAIENQSKLIASDFTGGVSVNHVDGSHMFFAGAIASIKGKYWVIFTEHHGFHVYESSEVKVRTYRF